MYSTDRGAMRRYFYETWKRHRAKQTLEPIQHLIAAVIETHPEYHSLIEDGSQLDRDFIPDDGATNPFLHMGMHLALREQTMTDRPPGIRALYLELARKFGGDHEAEHQMMECLGEILWTAQRSGGVPDTDKYLECVRKRARIAGTA